MNLKKEKEMNIRAFGGRKEKEKMIQLFCNLKQIKIIRKNENNHCSNSIWVSC